MYLFSRFGHLKKIILKGRGFRCGSDEKMMRMWFGLEIDVVGLPPLVKVYSEFKTFLFWLLSSQSSMFRLLISIYGDLRGTERSRTMPSFRKKNKSIERFLKNVGIICKGKKRNGTEQKFLKRFFKIRNAFILSRTRSKLRMHFKSDMCSKSFRNNCKIFWFDHSWTHSPSALAFPPL